MSFFRTLYGKLAAILVGLILLISIAYILLALMMNRLYLEAVDQSLNEPLARNIIAHIWSTQTDQDLETVDFRQAVKGLMLVNPRIEVYLLDVDGTILSYSAPPGKVVRKKIALAPLERFIAGQGEFPLRGDDPRSEGGSKIFSAAPVNKGGALVGYIYAVLESEAYASVAEIFQGDYVLRLAVWLAVGAGLVVLVVGLVAFNLVTRRVRRLSGAMLAFEASDFRQPVGGLAWAGRPGGDEIDKVGRTFEETSRRIARATLDILAGRPSDDVVNPEFLDRLS